LSTLSPAAHYALTDGFPVRGLGVPSTAVWKGDATVACIAAASILAKVTRDAIMTEMHDHWPQYDFARHKGYVTQSHADALTTWGPCPEHRRRYVNVRRSLRQLGTMGENDWVELEAPESAGEIA
jgi:ribonuclease HII